MLSKTAVKYIQSLSFKKFRDENALFIAEGPKIVEEIIAAGNFKVKAVYGLEEYISAVKSEFDQKSITYVTITDDDLKKISSMVHPNKVLAIIHQHPKIRTINLKENLTLILDDISDPGNMGTIIRIADWFGIEQIVCSNSCVDAYNSKVVQSSMGSIVRVNMFYTDLESFLNQNSNIPSYAAVISGDNVFQTHKPAKCFLVIGNEGKGISENILKKVSNRISIPKLGNAESLNAAVAAGILVAAFKN